MSRALRSPLFWILVAATGMRLAGLFWGLPSSDGWDDDGFAPRNFLTALALTYKPGSYFTYPPLHAFVLALLTLPGVLIALFSAPSHSQHDVIATFTQPGFMTFFSVAGRAVSIAMSLGIIWCLHEMARLVAGRRAGLLAAAACALGVTLTYYGQVSNLDVPYLFWACLALLLAMRASVEQRPRLFWWAALSAAASVATKDQAYALFLLSLPAWLALWFATDAWPRIHARRVLTTLVLAGIVAVLVVLLVDGALFNWSGFMKRVAFLAGPASQDYAEYTHDLTGRLALLGDMARYFGEGYLVTVLVLVVLGIALACRLRRRVAALLPLLAMVSFTLCFNFAALRTDARFLLPQAVLSSLYVGIAADALMFRTQRALAGRIAVAVVALLALHNCLAVSAAMLADPRYDAEAWMRAHIPPGARIETYGQNAFLPRFPRSARVTRVSDKPLNLRNPLPGVTEVRAPYDAILERGPRFIVVNRWWIGPYLGAPPQQPGHLWPPIRQAQTSDASATRLFMDLKKGRLPYRLAFAAAPHTGLWPELHIHESLNETILIFERLP